MRQALACVAGCRPENIPWIEPRSRRGGSDFWACYVAAAERLGYRMDMEVFQRACPWSAAVRPSGLWIAIVPSKGGLPETHAIAMRGDHIQHDAGPRRRRHPNKLLRIVTLVRV
jgi:hypothetical protein